MRTVQKYKTVAIPVRLWNEISRLVEATGMYGNEAEFVREAVRSKLGEVFVVEMRNIPEEKVEAEIVRYIRERGRAYPSDIAADLGIPYFTVTSTIEKLVEKGTLEPVAEG